jgi:succinyl-CoA synthetase alpha subunit
MPIKCVIRPNEYHDSVFLMAVARQAGRLPGVRRAALVMGTAMNKGLLKDMELFAADAADAGPNDLVIALNAGDDTALAAAQAEVERRLKEKHAARPARAAADGGAPECRTIAAALAREPGLNLALISLPGEYAAAEAAKALAQGLNVYMFSDDISCADEVMLKQLAREKNLMMMGPGCGLAFVRQTAIGLCSKTRPGPVGLIAASGSGLQETMVQIDRLGLGVSQAIGTGGRDLRDEVGGLATLQALDLLEADPATAVIVLISKPPGAKTAAAVLERVRACKKPVVVDFIGGSPAAVTAAGAHFAATFEEAAELAARLAGGGDAAPLSDDADARALAAREAAGLAPGQRYLRGIFCGGTLAEEAMMVMRPLLPEIHSNTAVMPEFNLKDARVSEKHTVIDIGTEDFTRGRPHAAIDPAPRVERFAAEAADPSVAVILLDFLLGYGCHADPCGIMADPIRDAIAAAKKAGRRLVVVASICGTELDPQRASAQREKLVAAGVLVMPGNAQAARLAGAIAASAASK